jgi:hypothetical protein
MTMEPSSSGDRRRKLFALADHLGLDRDERLELASSILWRDITSYSHLDDAQVDRMLDVLEGAEKVIHILSTRV